MEDGARVVEGDVSLFTDSLYKFLNQRNKVVEGIGHTGKRTPIDVGCDGAASPDVECSVQIGICAVAALRIPAVELGERYPIDELCRGEELLEVAL